MFMILSLGLTLIHCYELGNITIIMINWVIHFICLNMHGVHSARSYHSKAAEIILSQKPLRYQNIFNLGFSHACAVPDSYLIGEKKKSSHTKPRLRRVPLITDEVAASFCEATCFLSTPKGRMVSGTRLVTGTVSSAFVRCEIAR